MRLVVRASAKKQRFWVALTVLLLSACGTARTSFARAARNGDKTTKKSAGLTAYFAVTNVDGDSGSDLLRWMRASDGGKIETLASQRVGKDSGVRAARVGESVALVFEPVGANSRASFQAALFGLSGASAPNGQFKQLADRLYSGSWPIAVDTRRVLVARGFDPVESSADQDESATISCDLVDIETGRVRSLYVGRGFAAFPVGVLDDDAIIYVVGPSGGAIVRASIDRAVQKSRVVATIAPLARDFSVDTRRRALVYQNQSSDRTNWVIERLALDSGARTELVELSHYGIAPALIDDGRTLLFNASERSGLTSAELDQSAETRTAIAPAGPGLDEARPLTGDGELIGVVHAAPTSAREKTAWIYSRKTKRAFALKVPVDSRVEFVWADSGSAGAQRR